MQRLSPEFIDQLATLPESGMGYHRVDVTLADGTELVDITVINGTWIMLPLGRTVRELRPHI